MATQSSIDIENPKQTIQSCFKMMHYVVPAFQREYVWEDTQIEQLLNDIEEAFCHDSNKEYFCGTTVVFKDDDKMQLVDGQQRMTTFFLILCAISKRYLKNGESATAYEQLVNTPTVDSEGNTINSYTLELQYEDSSRCLSKIWEDSIPEDRDNLAQSSIRLYNAFEIISKKLYSDFPVFSDFKKFAAYFIGKVVFIQVGATNMADALKIFETINQRGVSLNPMDLLKNLLFMHVKTSDFEKLNGKWKTMVDKLEKIPEKPLRFLRYYITATYDISDIKKDYQGIINDDEIYDWLSKNNDKCHYKESPIKFTDDMLDGLNRYASFLNPGTDAVARCYLIDIKTIMGKSYRLHLVPLLASKSMDDTSREKLCKAIDMVIYYAVVNNITSNVLERLFSSWCPEIRAVTDEKGVESFIINKVKPTLMNWNLQYRQNFMQLGLNTLQKYKVKTILARIIKYVDAYRANDIKGAAEIEDYMKAANEIEHIMPVSCSNISVYGIKAQEDYDFQKNRLGNLTLLEKTLNASIQNDSYSDKLVAYANSKFYITRSLNGLVDVGGKTKINEMNKKLKTWTKWDSASIDERQEMLYTVSKDTFNIDNLISTAP